MIILFLFFTILCYHMKTEYNLQGWIVGYLN